MTFARRAFLLAAKMRSVPEGRLGSVMTVAKPFSDKTDSNSGPSTAKRISNSGATSRSLLAVCIIKGVPLTS